MQPQSIAIVGAGFTGTLMSLHLLRQCPPATRIQLIERSDTPGTGLAYSTPCPEHLLNVPAGKMSAFPDQPGDFLEWLQRQPTGVTGGFTPDAGSFVPRQLYGGYLQTLLADAIHACPSGRLERVRGTVVGISRQPAGLMLHLDGGRAVTASTVVMATGNHQPADPCPSLRNTSCYRPDPWSCDIADDLPPDAGVLLIGTGLTMVDTVLSLLRRGHRGPIHALSRRGLLPHSHARQPVTPPVFERHEIPRRLPELLRFMRTRAAQSTASGDSWHAIVDALRPITQELWRTASTTERRRFLVHLRPWWDVHRHRLAPAVADRIEATRASGQLRIHAGRITGCAADGNSAAVTLQPRGKATTTSLHVRRVINCTGPDTNVSRSRDPLVQSLLFSGMALPDPLGLGFQMTDSGAFCGEASGRLFGAGPVCRSALWEITAVPDIRKQCESLAQHIADLVRQRDASHWFPPPLPAEGPSLRVS